MGFSTGDLKSLLSDFACEMQQKRDYLCELDGAIGDADHGIAMELGMVAAAAAAKDLNVGTLRAICNAAAKGFLDAVGASSGPLYATALMRAGKSLGDVEKVPSHQLRDAIAAMADGIASRGKATAGQKTMVDAWLPAADAARRGASSQDISKAAREGAESTRNMVATLGRSARLGERSLGHPDPGAVSAAMIIALICQRFE